MLADSFVYAEMDSAGTVLRWLEHNAGGCRVLLVAPESEIAAVRELVSERGEVVDVLSLPQADSAAHCPLAQIRSTSASQTIVLPLALQYKPMRHVAGVVSPVMGERFALFRRLWRCGFREFKLTSPVGNRTLHLPYMLDDMVDRHKGQRCFVAGNGPSLNKIDMRLLKDEITFGSNRCFLGFDQWGFDFDYWACTDRLQLEEYAAEYEKGLSKKMLKFVPFDYLPFLGMENVCPFNQSYEELPEPPFSRSLEEMALGGTVTFCMMQIAAIMGCNPIILIGVDHSYAIGAAGGEPTVEEHSAFESLLERSKNSAKRVIRGTALYDLARAYRQIRRQSRRAADVPISVASQTAAAKRPANAWTDKEATSATHFHPQYTAGKHFVRWRPEFLERAYASAHNWCEANDVQILNATPGTHLHVFPKIEYDSLFGNAQRRCA